MKSMLSSVVGGPETLKLTELANPVAGPGQVLIRTRAASANFPDALMLRDLYQAKPPRPFAPGGEVAGEVEALGEGVTSLKVGDRVLALVGTGGFATHVVAEAARAHKIPDAMPFADAACLLYTYGTSHYALADCGAMQPGETLLVLGAAGGVGAAAIELGKAAGGRVIAAVSSPEKAAFCKELGADETLVYPRDLDRDGQRALGQQIKDLAGPAGVDLVYDAVGGDYAEPALRALNWNGRHLVVGFTAGIPKIPLNLVLLKSTSIVGVIWGAATLRDPARHIEALGELYALYAEGKIKPRISATFPLAQASEALVLMEGRKVMGKVVVTTD